MGGKSSWKKDRSMYTWHLQEIPPLSLHRSASGRIPVPGTCLTGETETGRLKARPLTRTCGLSGKVMIDHNSQSA